MSTPWQALLIDTPAHWHDGTLLGFSQSPDEELIAALEGDLVCPLPGLGAIEVGGQDATTFLQSQLSNDVESLPDGDSRLAAYCNPKGRMLALFRIVRTRDRYLLLLPRPLLDPVLKRLRMFVLRSKVTLSDVSDDWAALGISGEAAARRLAESGRSLPAGPDAGAWQNECGIIRLRGERPRGLILTRAEKMAQLWSSLGDLPQGGEPAWRLLDIRAGVPEVLPGTQESIIPQMANLDLLGGISFTKGCYPGQEIVARMHYLGNLKRRMYRAVLDTQELPAPGSEVRDESGSLAGELVMAAPAPNGQTEALAVLQIDRANGGNLQVAGHRLQVLPPPYPLTAE